MNDILLSTNGGPKKVPWDRFVEAVAQVESRGDSLARGKAGELGAWQFTASTWSDTSALLRRAGLPTYGFFWGANKPDIARQYADTWLSSLSQRLQPLLGRPATCQEVYAAYNMGLAGFRKRGLDLEHVPEVTKKGLQRLVDYLQ